MYRLNFVLMDSFGWNPYYIESLRMFEYEIFVDMLKERLKREDEERRKIKNRAR